MPTARILFLDDSIVTVHYALDVTAWFTSNFSITRDNLTEFMKRFEGFLMAFLFRSIDRNFKINIVLYSKGAEFELLLNDINIDESRTALFTMIDSLLEVNETLEYSGICLYKTV